MSILLEGLNRHSDVHNLTVDECYHNRNTVLQGQPFGGIPTVLFLNIALWVVSAGCCRDTQSQPGWATELSQEICWGLRLSRWALATVVQMT